MKSLYFFMAIQIFASSLLAQIRGADEFEIKRFTVSTNDETSITREHLLMDRITPLGNVKGSYLAGTFFSNDDLVYLQLKNPQVSVGDKLMIYDDHGPVEVPGKFQKSVGQDIMVKGFAEVTKIQGTAIIARLYDCSMQVAIGDKLTSLIDLNFKIAPKEPIKMIRGIVLRSSKDLGIIGPYDFVYLNKGSKDGLDLNDHLYVTRSAELNWGAGSNEKKPPVNIAELVIVHTGENVSTAYVLGAENSFAPGSSFKSAISDVKFLNDQDLKAGMAESAAAKPEGQQEEEIEDDGSNQASDSFEDQNANSYFLLGAGMFEMIDRDGIHRPFFTVTGEYGGETFAMPFRFNVRYGDYQEIEAGLTYHRFFQPIASSPKFVLILGAGPFVNYGFLNGKTASGQTIELGLMATAQARYYFSDQIFFFADPVDPNLSIWHYSSAKVKGFKATSESSVDLRGRIYTSAGLGWNF